jgi:hypothetical protein
MEVILEASANVSMQITKPHGLHVDANNLHAAYIKICVEEKDHFIMFIHS